MNFKNSVLIGLAVVGLALGGWLLYKHVPKPPPAPKDLTKVFPQQLLQRANASQLAVLRGTAAVAFKTAPEPTPKGSADTGTPALADTSSVPGLTFTLASDGPATLKATATNATGAALSWSFPAGTLFSNGTGNVVLLRDVATSVPPRATVQFTLPVAVTDTSKGVLQGTFSRQEESMPELKPLLKVIAGKKSLSFGAMQTAVLALSENIPLDDVSSFPPNLRPPSVVNNDPMPFRVSTADIMSALALLQAAGVDAGKMALAGDPEFKLMTMLNPESHAAAKTLFGISNRQEWSYWRHQLLAGDPALRHYALYGIARYYPDVALQMLPNWVRAPNVSRSFRVSAAWALALIDDGRAKLELVALRQELADDPGLRQALDRALRHWSAKDSVMTAKAG
jgi:hypothetical protein